MATAYRIDEDAGATLRDELVARVAQLRRDRNLLSVRELGRRSDALRTQAVRAGHLALAKLAGALSDALATEGRAAPVSAYIERMDDALGCLPSDATAGEALLAAVSIRRA